MKKLTIFVVIGIVILIILLGILIPLLEKTTLELIPEWERTLNGEPNWHATSFTEFNGDICVLGYAYRSGVGDQELYISGYNTEGEMIWEEIWGTTEFDRAYEITSYDDSLYIVGETEESNNDVLLLKYNSNGDVEWVRTWDANNDEIGIGITVYDDHIYIVGNIRVNHRYEEAFILKYDLLGNLIWNKTWSDRDRNMLFEITAYGNNLYIVGSTKNSGTWDYYDVLLKYDTDGNFIWNRTWFVGDSSHDWTRGLLSYNNGIYVVGSTYSYENPRIYITRYDINGRKTWEKTWYGVSNSRNYGKGISSYEGNLFVIGTTTMKTTHNTDIVLLKYDITGELIWSKTWGSDQGEGALDIIESNGFLYILGEYLNLESYNERNFILKVNTFEIPQYLGAIIIIFGIILVIIIDAMLIYRKKKNQKDATSSDPGIEEQGITLKTMEKENNEIIDNK